MTQAVKRTPLHPEHLRLGGKMVPFAGFELPVHYPAGIHAEHHAVRTAAGLFDVSHMGEIEVSGRKAADRVQWLTVNDVALLEDGQVQYSMMCTESGGVVDDLLVCRMSDSRYLLVVNAVNRDTDLAWVRSQAHGFEVEVHDRSDQTALLALQGPASADILGRLSSIDPGTLRAFRFVRAQVAERRALISRTGYTGEDGFELYLETDDAIPVWNALLDAGSDLRILPCGLGARDTLRLEAGLPLHGAELDGGHSPLEAGLGWVVKLDRESFLGKDALVEQKKEGVDRKLVGIRLEKRGFPRSGYPVVSEGSEVGTVSSGTLSPTLEVGIAIAWVRARFGEVGTSLAIRIRDRDVPGRVVELPFYRRPGDRR
ncbi:MAG: glycine cleavage system aminomethyltransferase GcvT [Gemmatimonadota bacterium]